MHGIADIRRGNKDVALELAFGAGREGIRIRGHKAIAVTMHVQPSSNQVLAGRGSGQAPAVLADPDQLALAGHLLQEGFQRPSLPAFEREVMDQLLEASRVFWLFADVAKYLLVVNHGFWALKSA